MNSLKVRVGALAFSKAHDGSGPSHYTNSGTGGLHLLAALITDVE